jgi:hypothetical protein
MSPASVQGAARPSVSTAGFRVAPHHGGATTFSIALDAAAPRWVATDLTTCDVARRHHTVSLSAARGRSHYAAQPVLPRAGLASTLSGCSPWIESTLRRSQPRSRMRVVQRVEVGDGTLLLVPALREPVE